MSRGSEDVVHLDVFVEEIDLDKGTMSSRNFTLNMTNGVHEPTEEELRHSVMIFYIVLFVMIGAQSALVRWRKAHRRSYELVTLIGLWLVPPVISVQLLYWRFILVWWFLFWFCVSEQFLFLSGMNADLVPVLYRYRLRVL